MSEYHNFTTDFIRRTRLNLENYIGDFEVTCLINCAMGLLVLPAARFVEDLPGNISIFDVPGFGIEPENIRFEVSSNFSIRKTVKHIRNGIAHGRIEQKTKHGEIVGIQITDRYPESLTDNFYFTCSIETLYTFFGYMAKIFLEEESLSDSVVLPCTTE